MPWFTPSFIISLKDTILYNLYSRCCFALLLVPVPPDLFMCTFVLFISSSLSLSFSLSFCLFFCLSLSACLPISQSVSTHMVKTEGAPLITETCWGFSRLKAGFPRHCSQRFAHRGMLSLSNKLKSVDWTYYIYYAILYCSGAQPFWPGGRVACDSPVVKKP